MLTRFLRATNRNKNIQAGLDKSSFERLPFSYSFNNLVKAYDLRQWYILNSQNEEQRFKYTLELEQLHNELNYLTLRTMMKRYAIFTLGFFGFYLFVFEAGNFDWFENWDPKHDLKVYGELEESMGDEGGDDD